MYDFANILFSGPCNARCPFCIGKLVDPRLNQDNLAVYPLRNLDRLVALLWRHRVRKVVFTGTNSDPLLYCYLGETLAYLRQKLHPETGYSLHSNGRLLLHKLDLVNQFDRVCLSIPSFDPYIYCQMMGVRKPPNLEQILRKTQPPVKISCIVSDQNRSEIGAFLAYCRESGIQRVVLRKPFGEGRSWRALLDLPGLGMTMCGEFRHNPVYNFEDMEVTLWDFELSSSTSLNLFSSGLISERYLLVEAGK